MKEIYYQDLPQPFVLTDKEFFEAYKAWNKRESYWCDRLDALLGPFIRFAKTPDSEDGREILVRAGDKWERKYFKNKEKYFEVLPGGQLLEVSFTKEIIKELIPQEDLLNKHKKLLT